MGTGQMMLTIGAFVLLGVIILSVNAGFLTVNTTVYSSRVDIMAVSLANSIIEDAASLAFDEKTVGAAITSTSSLTAPASLGLDGTENRSIVNSFDDFDDYNCYRTNPKLDTILVPGSTSKFIFSTYCAVDYVDPANPDNISSTATYAKRLKLRTYLPGMTDTIRISKVYSYWYFR